MGRYSIRFEYKVTDPVSVRWERAHLTHWQVLGHLSLIGGIPVASPNLQYNREIF